jgi:hypothetical protein
MEYIAGQGYKDGYRDRNEGKANMAAFGRVTENTMYWNEYDMGWNTADAAIIQEAREKSRNGRNFLVD